ncbi:MULTISPECIES: sec-independent translocase [Streptomyces]|uniref:Sec-independent protein translocase protein TatB n=1 Tax=Streptomyces lonegramiae TaxID=3075524 RepID=A0ABU2XNN4_9ACTN|nr:sec-independent translocase [Streptomyces sp. DSM 41529]MDT0547136.1 sec-independent translocase [Streptomyces sp. DSM 41529]
MFFDIGPLELIALVVLAVLVFGPEKLPKVIQDVSRFIRKVREFSDNAKEDIRSELGPEFKDFEFEDLNPKNFVRKHVLDSDELGLKEIRNGFDLRKEMAEVADSVNGRESDSAQGSSGSSPASQSGGGSGTDSGSSTPDLLRKREEPKREERPPFDSDAT